MEMVLFWLLSLSQEAQPGKPAIAIRHSKPEFRVTLPKGYEPLATVPPNVIYGYQRAFSDGTRIALTFEVLAGRIDRSEPTDAELNAAALKTLPPGSTIRKGRERWGEHELLVQESSLTMNGAEMLALIVQFPTLPQCVQINMAGSKSVEPKMREDLKALLRSFRGTTDWLTPQQRILGGVSGGAGVLAWLLLLIYGVLYLFRWRRGSMDNVGFRVTYLTITVIVFSIAIAGGAWYQSTKDRPMDIAFYVLTGTALACAVNTGQLYQKARELKNPKPADSGPVNA